MNRITTNFDSRGTWMLKSTDAQGDAVRYGRVVVETLPGGYEITSKRGGTCDRCGQSIHYIARVECADGFALVGLDCAETLCSSAADRAIISLAVRAHTKATRDARIAKKRAEIVAKYESLATQCDAIAECHPQFSFERRFARSLARQIRNGALPSAKQIALVGRISATGEVATQ